MVFALLGGCFLLEFGASKSAGSLGIPNFVVDSTTVFRFEAIALVATEISKRFTLLVCFTRGGDGEFCGAFEFVSVGNSSLRAELVD